MISLRMRPPADRMPGMISVTLPSRRRAAMLTASIHSLRTTAKRPDLLEFLVATDPDDPDTAWVGDDLGAQVWTAPERYGYGRSARYYAALLERARGEWLLPTWGDDGLMQTEGWDEIVRAQSAGSVIYVDGNFPGLTCFPIVHADVLSTLGRLTDLPALDTWFEDVGREADVLVHPDPPVFVLQDRFDLTGRNDDEVYREGRTGYRSEEYHAGLARLARTSDAIALRQARRLDREYRQRLVPYSDMQTQMPHLYDAVRRYRGCRVVELGTRGGNSTAALLAAAATVAGSVVAIDLAEPATPLWWRSDLAMYRQVRGDDTAPEVVSLVDECDVLLIDTSHHFEHTLAELCAWVPKVAPGGVVFCHDTELSAAEIQAYEGRHPGGPDYPVAAALDQFCAEAGLTWENIPGNYGLGIIHIGGTR